MHEDLGSLDFYILPLRPLDYPCEGAKEEI